MDDVLLYVVTAFKFSLEQWVVVGVFSKIEDAESLRDGPAAEGYLPRSAVIERMRVDELADQMIRDRLGGLRGTVVTITVPK